MHARYSVHNPRAPEQWRRVISTGTLSLCFLALWLSPPAAQAEWSQTNGPKGGVVRAFVAVPNGSGASLYTGGWYVRRTTDNGASWTLLRNGLSDPNVFALIAVPNGSGGNDILAGTNGGVFRTTDNGATWSAINTGLTNLSVYALTSGSNGAGGTNLYAGTYPNGVFRSTNNGASWAPVNNGLPTTSINSVSTLITTASGTVLAGVRDGGMYRTTNFGASWTRVFTLTVLSFARNGAAIYAGTSGGVHFSTNDGASWTAINNGITYTWIYAMAAIPNGPGVILFANNVRSTNNGATWTLSNSGLTNPSIYALTTAPGAAGGTNLFAGTAEGVFLSTNTGINWSNVSFVYSQVQAVAVSPAGSIVAGTENDVFRSNDGGAHWTDGQTNFPTLGLAVNIDGAGGASLFAGGSPGGVLRSTDDGVSWTGASNGLDDFDVNSMGSSPNGSGGTNLFAGTYSGLYISTDNGAVWSFAGLNTLTLAYVTVPSGTGETNLFAGGFGGIWVSTNFGAAWTQSGLTSYTVSGLTATSNGTNIFAGTYEAGVFRSTNSGATWSPVNNGLTNLTVNDILSPDGTNLFAGGSGGVFLSPDNGSSWTPVSSGMAGIGVYALAVNPAGSGPTLVAGTTGFGVWKRPLSEMINVPPPVPPAISFFTPTSGSAGTQVTITGSNFVGASAVAFHGTNAASFSVDSDTKVRATVPTGATTGKISVSTAAGTAVSATDFTVTAAPPPPSTFTFTPPHDAWVRSSTPGSNFGSAAQLRVRGGGQTIRSYLKFSVAGLTGTVQSARLRLFVTDAGPNGGSVYSVSNNYSGSSTPWTESGLTWNNAPAISGAALAATGSVALNTWVEVNVTSAITGNGTFSFGFTSSSSNVVDYSSSEGSNPPQLVVVAASVPKIADPDLVTRPTTTALGNNYPNPFNPSTRIGFRITESGFVSLRVFDLLGREVATLVNGVLDAGSHEVVFDGTGLASGTYFYRLRAGEFVETKRLLMQK